VQAYRHAARGDDELKGTNLRLVRVRQRAFCVIANLHSKANQQLPDFLDVIQMALHAW
jgi:hypothetical protein